MSVISDFLHAQPVLVFFLVLAAGYLVGRFTVAGINLGSAGGVLLAGLLFGHWGFEMYPAIQTLGFAIFIFCVGYQAGPQFFDVLLTSGLKYLSLALVVALTGFGLTVVLSAVFEFQPGINAGLLGGALTTTPTLAAAQDAVRSGLVDIPAGYDADTILTNIGAGYALTYLFGLIGLILAIRILPRILGVDLAVEAAKLETGQSDSDVIDLSKISRRTYRVTREDLLDKTVEELERTIPGSLSIVGVRRAGEVIDVSYDSRLEIGDEILVVGRVEHLVAQAPRFGEEIADEAGLGVSMSTFHAVVSNPDVIGKPLREIHLADRLGALPVKIRRLRSELPLTTDMELHRGDVITFFGPDVSADRVVRQVGHVERDVADTDLFTFALGIAGGITLGALAVTLGNIRIELGMAGGLLITGLLIGFLRSIFPVFGRVPSASRWVLMELGLLMFMAGVGLNAGGGIVEIIQHSGFQLIGSGILVTLIPIIVGYAFSRGVLKLNAAEAFGGVTGSMTSGAALSVVCDAAKSNVPALGYTGAYAFANVILTVAGTVIMLI